MLRACLSVALRILILAAVVVSAGGAIVSRRPVASVVLALSRLTIAALLRRSAFFLFLLGFVKAGNTVLPYEVDKLRALLLLF